MLREVKNIVVGVEPLGEPVSHLERVKTALGWFGRGHTSTHVVSVLNPDDLGLPANLSDKISDASIVDKVLEDLKRRSQILKSDKSLEILSLISDNLSKAEAVHKLLKFAQSVRCDLIVAHSHTKSIFKDSLGSFCHHLATQSTIPLLVLPSEGQLPEAIKTIVYPTDFSELSRSVFISLLEFAAPLKAKIQIYHRRPRVADMILQTMLHPIENRVILPSDLLSLSEKEILAKADEWQAIGKEQHAQIEIATNTDKLTLPEAIIHQAESAGADLIVLPSHTSALNVLSFGHTPAHLLRTSPVPVIVVPVAYTPPGKRLNNA